MRWVRSRTLFRALLLPPAARPAPDTLGLLVSGGSSIQIAASTSTHSSERKMFLVLICCHSFSFYLHAYCNAVSVAGLYNLSYLN